ncbi:MAG TPA: hypothetical protein VHL77_03285 [Ferruginibacter sp.]|jgi:hypothetical protein|nr:hypothetical protein [Ferruginibacter sp.]
MRNLVKNDFLNIPAAQFKEIRKNLAVKKNPRYIYSEADLRDVITEGGLSKDQQNNLHTKPWASMLRTPLP